MKKFPNKVKFKKNHLIRTFSGRKGIRLSCFTIGLQLQNNCYLSHKQLEEARRVIVRLLRPKSRKNTKDKRYIQLKKKKAKKRKKKTRLKYLLIKSNLTAPITKKPLQVRMGKGKGSLDHYVSVAKKSRIIFEISRQRLKLHRVNKLFCYSGLKLPSPNKIVYSKCYVRRETNNNYTNKIYFKGF
jgi:large subunit ribosomal protein L16